MNSQIYQLGPFGRTLRYENRDDQYPVNRYQSLFLANAAFYEVLSFSERSGCPLRQLRAMEACCGVGPTALTLKAAGVGYVEASDINPIALHECERNAALNEVVLDRIQSRDILSAPPHDLLPFDLLACNPPCGRTADCPADVGSAFRRAVNGGHDGSEFTLSLLERASDWLAPNGVLLFVLTSSVAFVSVLQKLDEVFTNSWRLAANGPTAQPWKRLDWAHTEGYLHRADDGDVFVWSDADWLWRFSWVIVAGRKELAHPLNAQSFRRVAFTNATYDIPNESYQQRYRQMQERSLTLSTG